jgi:LmbE family N-acetylglucosaminyl deacetylase
MAPQSTELVVVVVAHADDETLGCGGTLARWAAAGVSIQVVVLSDGYITTRPSAGVQDNLSAATAACQTLGLTLPPISLGLPDQRFDTLALADIVNALNATGLSPCWVLTHDSTDLNRDHRLTLEAVQVWTRPRHGRRIHLLTIESPLAASFHHTPFQPNYYVDITATFAAKLAAFQHYQHEVRTGLDPCSEEGLRRLARYRGLEAQYDLAEAFRLLRYFA